MDEERSLSHNASVVLDRASNRGEEIENPISRPTEEDQAYQRQHYAEYRPVRAQTAGYQQYAPQITRPWHVQPARTTSQPRDVEDVNISQNNISRINT